MSISKEELLKRKEEIVTDYNNLVKELEKGETSVRTMKNNLNALSGALQQVELFIQQVEDDGDKMPAEKEFALNMATGGQENTMRITEEKEESNGMIHETLTTNPRDEIPNDDIVEGESTEKEKKEDEKL